MPASESKSGVYSEEEQAVISRALGYPYARPSGSFLYKDGESEPLRGAARGGTLVLAIGSNAAPSQLRRKFGAGEMAVVSVEVHGLDVVYAAMVSNYGSVPATVVKSGGTAVRMHANVLDGRQLGRMHETEGGYTFCRLACGRGVRVVRADADEAEAEVFCYVAQRGAVRVDGEAVALREIGAAQRRYRALGQREMQGVVRGLVGWDESVEEFVLRNVGDKGRRDAAMRAMQGSDGLEDCWEEVQDLGKEVRSIA